MSNSVCRVCLAVDLRMLCIENIGLQEIYESITNTKLVMEATKPLAICYICCSQLQRCQKFRQMSQRAEKMFTDILNSGAEITQEAVQELDLRIEHDLSVTTIQLMSFNDQLYNKRISVAVKEEFNRVEESSSSTPFSVNEIEDNVMLTWETDHTLDLRMKESAVNKNQHISSRDENIPVAVKEEFNYDEECSTDDIEDETITRETFHKKVDLEIRQDLSDSTTQVMSENNDSTPVAVKEEFNYDEECSTDDIEDETVTNNVSKQNKKNTSITTKSCHRCDICSKTLSTKKKLIAHLQLHTREGSYACRQCEKIFYNISSFETHLKIHAGEKPFACNQCDKTYSMKQYLRRHISVHYIEKSLICHYCKKAFSEKKHLLKHLRLHIGKKPKEKFICLKCKKSFCSSYVLRIHMKIHTGDRPFACSQCEKTFTLNYNCQIHMRSHTGEKPYSCSNCNKAFINKSHLRRHINTHAAEKPYVCSHCNKAFTDKSHLLRHMKTHVGEKPFTCSQCHKSYSRNCHLKRHELKHT